MTDTMINLVKLLVEEHRRLMALIEALDAILSPKVIPPANHTKLRQLFEQVIHLMAAHGETERKKLLPALQRRLPEADHWQIKMLEIQDEAILSEARHLHEWLVEHPPPASFERLRKDGVRLIRWAREHIGFEEERLFPRLL
jgi:hemerythrin-like domain-containing protein